MARSRKFLDTGARAPARTLGRSCPDRTPYAYARAKASMLMLADGGGGSDGRSPPGLARPSATLSTARGFRTSWMHMMIIQIQKAK